MMEYLVAALDFFILAWLVATWFYEGHHRRCTVIARCPSCGKQHDIDCKTRFFEGGQ